MIFFVTKEGVDTVAPFGECAGMMEPVTSRDVEKSLMALGAALTCSSEKMSDIAKRVAIQHGVTVADLKGGKRTWDCVFPRHEAMFLCRKEGNSLTKIGRFFNRDHTTVLNGIRRHEQRMVG